MICPWITPNNAHSRRASNYSRRAFNSKTNGEPCPCKSLTLFIFWLLAPIPWCQSQELLNCAIKWLGMYCQDIGNCTLQFQWLQCISSMTFCSGWNHGQTVIIILEQHRSQKPLKSNGSGSRITTKRVIHHWKGYLL